MARRCCRLGTEERFGPRALAVRQPDEWHREGQLVGIGLVLMPAKAKHDWALGNYAALGSRWRADLESIVGCHVSLVPMVAGYVSESAANSQPAVTSCASTRPWLG
jgi:hypothetical protein